MNLYKEVPRQINICRQRINQNIPSILSAKSNCSRNGGISYNAGWVDITDIVVIVADTYEHTVEKNISSK